MSQITNQCDQSLEGQVLIDRARPIYGLRIAVPAQRTTGDRTPQAERNERIRDRAIIELHGDSVNLMVKWDGSANTLGQMQVEVTPGAWQDLEYLVPGANDTLDVSSVALGQAFTAKIQRGGAHSGYRFKVKAVPIVWKAALPTDDTRFSFVVEQGVHYDYMPGATPADMSYAFSMLDAGVQRAEVEFVVGRDYELWVGLQSPDDPDHWIEQDPIIRTGTGSGGSGY